MRYIGIENGLEVPPSQEIHSVRTAAQGPAYSLGQKFWYGDRCYKYARAGGTLIVHRCVAGADNGISGWAVVPTATAAGSRTVWATIGAAEGQGNDGAVAKDSLAGGYVTVFRLQAGAHNTDYTFRIETNTVVAAGGGNTELTIDQNLPFACSTSAYTEITGNPYEEVEHITLGSRMFLGQPMYPATEGEYLWLQTMGPTWINPNGTPGNVSHDSQLCFDGDGSICVHNAANATTLFKQHAGVVMTRVAGGAETQGTPLVFLQISC